MQTRKLILPLFILAAAGLALRARAKVIDDPNGSLKTLTSIGDALDSPDHHPVHILYVHGISQVGAGDSSLFRASICTELKLCAVCDWKNAGIEFADKGEFAGAFAAHARVPWQPGLEQRGRMARRRALCCALGGPSSPSSRRPGGRRDQLVAARPGAQMPPHRGPRGLSRRTRPHSAEGLLGTIRAGSGRGGTLLSVDLGR